MTAAMPTRAAVAAMVAGLAGCVAGCVEITDLGGPWTDLAEITGPFATEQGPPPATPPVAGCTLRIASWNVHFGADPDDLAARILASTEIARADVLITQEVEAHPDEAASRAQRLATALGMTWIYAPARFEGNGTHGIAILSRYPLEAGAVRQLPYIDRPITPSNRIALAADIVLGADRVRMIDVHLDTRLSPSDRILQMHPAINEITDRALVGGDFNTQPWEWIDGVVPVTSTQAVIGQDHAQVLDDYLAYNAFAGALTPATTTMRVPVFSMRLDNLYARGYPIVASGVEHVEGSDHWPIWFDIDRCP